MSVSPPPGGGSGLASIGETMWTESPRSAERWTKLCDVDVPHGPDSHSLPSLSTWIIGSPSARSGSATVPGPTTRPPAGLVGLGGAGHGATLGTADAES